MASGHVSRMAVPAAPPTAPPPPAAAAAAAADAAPAADADLSARQSGESESTDADDCTAALLQGSKHEASVPPPPPAPAAESTFGGSTPLPPSVKISPTHFIADLPLGNIDQNHAPPHCQ